MMMMRIYAMLGLVAEGTRTPAIQLTYGSENSPVTDWTLVIEGSVWSAAAPVSAD